MTVVEMIEKLMDFPPDMPVVEYDEERRDFHEIEWIGKVRDGGGDAVAVHAYKIASKEESDAKREA